MVVLFVLGELVLSSLAGGEFQQPVKKMSRAGGKPGNWLEKAANVTSTPARAESARA
jgi:hypothetical protein